VHKHTKKLVVSLALAGALFGSVSSAFANDCTVANKTVGAGSVGTVDVTTGAFTPTKSNPGTEAQPHGAFVTLTGLPIGTVDTYVHAPTNAQAPFAEPGVNPGATNQEQKGKGCDGKGHDTIDACLG
jgi:hypothetical protein